MKLIVDYVSSNEYPDHFTIGDLLRYKDVEPVPWLIVAVNDVFYKRDKFDDTLLHDGDRVDLIYVRGGGQSMDKLNEEQLNRYYRSIRLEEIGEEGQLKLLNSSVLVVGAGGLGSIVLTYLVSSGIGHIGIIDDDSVSLDNLPRQVLYNSSDIGKKKVQVAKKKLKSLNKDVTIKIYDERLTEDNAKRVTKKYDLILDCTDNFKTKFLINDMCVALKKPFISGGVTDYQGQVMTYIPKKSKDFKSLFDELPKDDGIKRGVLPSAVGLIGSIQASEAIKYLVGFGDLLTDHLLVVDTLNWNIRKINF